MNKITLLTLILATILFSCKDDDSDKTGPSGLDNPSSPLKDTVIINPKQYAPLTAIAHHSTSQNTRVVLTIKANKTGSPDLVHNFNELKKDHMTPIIGLYAAFNNTVYLDYFNANNELIDQEIHMIKTDSINFNKPIIRIDIVNETAMEPGMTLVSSKGNTPDAPYIFDNKGEIRWYLDYTNHPILSSLSYSVGIEKLENGNFYFGNSVTAKIYEVDIFGEIQNTWGLQGYDFHHNVFERANGNFILTAESKSSTHLNGSPTNEDFVIEIDRNSDALTVYDLKESLDEYRTTLIDNLNKNPIDWFHGNGIVESDDNAAIIVSGRTQGYVKLDPSNRPIWIVSPHKGWDTSRAGLDLNQFLLTPLDANNQAIIDTNVIFGNTNHPDFEWPWYGHAPLVMPNGNLMVFDNGDHRNYMTNDNYSRAVEYKINEQNMTIKQVWSYGKLRGTATASRIVSDVDYYPNSDNVIFAPGYNIDNGNGTGGKVIEVDYSTKTVVFEASITVPAEMAFHRVERISIY